jgi:small subunit ribosomal protein S9
VVSEKKQSYFYGTGRRKTSIARVRLVPGTGEIIINGIPYEQLFVRAEHRRVITKPLLVTENLGKYNTVVKVDESLRPVLRQNGLLTRDPRVKERKKPGLRRARKAPQYTKR